MNTSIILILIFLVILQQLIIILLSNPNRRKYEHDLRTERTIGSFAQARNNLMALALEDKIDINSSTFQSLYEINTFVMRRPDKYKEISFFLMKVILEKEDCKEGKYSIEKESKNWSPEIKIVVKETATAIGNLIFDYSPYLRLLFSIQQKLRQVSNFIGFLDRIKDKIMKNDPIISNFAKVKSEMYEIAM